jgi:predicted nucleotidyltransferase
MIDLSPRALEVVQAILERRLPDREVWVFGSRATGRARKYSDLDLAILGETPLSLASLATVADEFDESDLPFKVDVVDWALISPAFREIIRRDAAVVQRGTEASPPAGSPAPER